METLGERLRAARLANKLSLREVAALLAARAEGFCGGNKSYVSHVTLANYESGKHPAPPEMLLFLAEVYNVPLRSLTTQAPSPAKLTNIRYRDRKSRVKVAERAHFVEQSTRWLHAYLAVEEITHSPLEKSALLKQTLNTEPDQAARSVREALELSPAEPITKATYLLDRIGIRTLEIESEAAIDGLAGKLNDDHVIILKNGLSGDRIRMNALHELGHILFGDCEEIGEEGKLAEENAFSFASHLLLPEEKLREAFRGQSMVRLVQFKEMFGISLAAMIFRAEKSGILTSATARRLWIEFSKRGWRTAEPGVVQAERAIRFEMLLDQAIQGDLLRWEDIPPRLGVSEEDVRKRLDNALGMNFVTRKEDDNESTERED